MASFTPVHLNVFSTLASNHNNHNRAQILQNLLMLLEVKPDEELCRLMAEQGTSDTNGNQNGCGGIVLGMVAHPHGDRNDNTKTANIQSRQHSGSHPQASRARQHLTRNHYDERGSEGNGDSDEPCHDHDASTCPHPDCHNGPCRCHECLHADNSQNGGIQKQRFSARHLRDSIPDDYKVLLAPPINLSPERVIRQLYPQAHIIEGVSGTESLLADQLPRRSRRPSAPDLAMPANNEASFTNVVRASTENESRYNNLENKTFEEILDEINAEDRQVASALERSGTTILTLLQQVRETINRHGRVFLIGAGSSGRLATVSSVTSPERLIALIAGGDSAIAKSRGGAEDSFTEAWRELTEQHHINQHDLLIGITASGWTPYVVGALAIARKKGIPTGSIACSSDAKISGLSDAPVEINAGPEYVTGSTRMKSATAQKLILDMVSMVALNPKQDLKALLHRFIQGSSDITKALSQSLTQLKALIEMVTTVIQNQGRLIYLGSDLAGRMAVIDASECPPTFNVNIVTGLIEGGGHALRHNLNTAQRENANAPEDLESEGVTHRDIVVGVGIETTFGYVQGGLTHANIVGAATGSIVVRSNPDQNDHQNVIISLPVSENSAEYEALAGTAIKQALNMLTTAVMIKHGRVAGNRMSHMQASNEKLVAREAVNLSHIEGIALLTARVLLTIFKSTAAAMKYLNEMQKPPEPR